MATLSREVQYLKMNYLKQIRVKHDNSEEKSIYQQFTIVTNFVMELLEHQLFSWMLVSYKASLELLRTSDAFLLNSLVYTEVSGRHQLFFMALINILPQDSEDHCSEEFYL